MPEPTETTQQGEGPTTAAEHPLGPVHVLEHAEWQVPEFRRLLFADKRSEYCVCTPVINEGQRIATLLERMRSVMGAVDVFIADGGSTDGSLEPGFLATTGVRGLLTKLGPGRLGAQMRMAMAYVLEEGYRGVIFIDGNNKDDPEAIPRFIAELEAGVDFVQASRYIPGGRGVNTPLSRYLAIRFLHAPLVSLAARRRYTDTTNGFRGYSARLLLDERVQPFRDVFSSYEILFYLAISAARLGLNVKEIPTTRAYPPGKPPTKISRLGGNLEQLKILFRAVTTGYSP